MSKNLLRAATALPLAVATTAALAVSAAPAQAAGTSAPDLRFCMKYSNGSAYSAKPVYLYRYDFGQGKWISYRSGSTNTYGCATWRDVRPNTWHAVQGYWNYSVGYSMYAWEGWTQSVKVGNVYDGQYNAGTGTAYFRQLY